MDTFALGGQFNLRENVEYVLRDKFGNVKPIFQENKLWYFLQKKLGIRAPQIPLLFGHWALSKKISNLVVSAGKAGMASRLNGDGAEAAFTYIALGTGTTAAAAGNTTLETETSASGLARAAGTASRVTTSVTNDTARLAKTFTNASGGNVAVTESGVLNAASTGTLLSRQVFSAVNVANGDSLAITWNFQIS